MPSQRQLNYRIEAAEHKALDREEEAAAIDDQGYYWHYNGGDFDEPSYERAHLVKMTKQYVFLKHNDHHWEHTNRCRKADFDKGYAWVGRGTGGECYYRGDAVRRKLLEEAARYRQEAENLRTQTPTPPDPTSLCTASLTMFYVDQHENTLQLVLDHASTPEDYADLIDIARWYRDSTMVRLLQGEITVDEYWAISDGEFDDGEFNDCASLATVNWIKEGF